MRRRMSIQAIAAASVLGLSIGFAGAQQGTTELQQFEQRAAAVDSQAASSPQALTAALHTISVETGVPQETVQAQYQQYSKLGVAGVLAANVLADATKKGPEVFLQAKQGGQTWVQIAQANNVPLSRLTTRLANVERTIGTPGQTVGSAQTASTGQKEFDQAGVALNRRAERSPQEMAAALHAISVQTGVPLTTVQAQHRRFPNVGVAGLLAANVMADETKKKPEVFLQAKAAGQTWTQIAQANNVPISKLQTRLANVEQRMAPTAAPTGR